jgi:hypothetical protein
MLARLTSDVRRPETILLVVEDARVDPTGRGAAGDPPALLLSRQGRAVRSLFDDARLGLRTSCLPSIR